MISQMPSAGIQYVISHMPSVGIQCAQCLVHASDVISHMPCRGIQCDKSYA